MCLDVLDVSLFSLESPYFIIILNKTVQIVFSFPHLILLTPKYTPTYTMNPFTILKNI